MGLDIRITSQEPIVCPHCGEVVSYQTVEVVDSSGSRWYAYLESIGYYVPYEKRTEANDWYSKDMALTTEQAEELVRYASRFQMYEHESIKNLVYDALNYGNRIVINADW